MRRIVRIMVVALILMGVLLLAGCGNNSHPSKVEPAHVEEIPGSEFKRVILTEKAAGRVGIETTPVGEEQVLRKRTVGGQVVLPTEAQAANPGPVWARVSLSRSDRDRVDQGQPTLVLALDGDDEQEGGWIAEPDEGPAHDDPEDVDLRGEDFAEELYYLIDSPGHGLVAGQAVLVELSLSVQETLRKVVPYAAVLYGVHGETWVYSNPEPLVYVRQPIVVDYIEGDLAYLLEGPETGTAVVTVGAAELFGTETGVSK
jgi:hypothetical protein